MENNSIHPDEMERLLRETFLDSDFPETDSITDLMAQQAFNTPWTAVPPVSKEISLLAKKGFLAGFSLNTLIGAVLVLGLGLGTGAYLLLQQRNTSTAGNTLAQASPLIAPKTVPATVHASTPPATLLTDVPQKKEQALKPSPLPDPEAPKTTPTLRDTTPPVSKSKTHGPSNGSFEKKVPKRYVIIPDITPAQAAENERRKFEMVRQTIKQDKKEWAYIPMGTTYLNDKPVSLQAFYMQTHEVTNLQYKTFLFDLVLKNRLRDYEKASVHDDGWIAFDMGNFSETYFWHAMYNQYPVVNVSPEGAKMYCDWLTTEINQTLTEKKQALVNDLRLPTEEEWIYAARADNDSAIYAWKGNTLLDSRGNMQANFHDVRGADFDGHHLVAPTASFLPNGWGVYDLCGNVAEMVYPIQGETITVKGGAWNQPAQNMQLLLQNRIPLNKLPMATVGFRPVYTFIAR